ncbi:alpha/beta fold hydrolase [Nonomuraea roseoviolacea subsp. roseoviolacea]|uniref:alpha/beta fold hydrolase n=1 Tax=Nonomuraea roseoviolacea TaxID=103837 RepID=UPI0031DFBEAB
MQTNLIDIDGVQLHTEEFGDPDGTPILLVMGSMSQGVLWPDAFVGRLVAGGRRVIRYDHRDTGRSAVFDFAAQPYTWDDIKDDVLRVMDAYGLESAHLVCHSAGGLLGQYIAVEHPERVRTLTVIGSSPLGGREGAVIMRALMGEPQPEGSLPPPRPEFVDHFRKVIASPPPASRREQIDRMIEEARVLHGTALPFDEDAERQLQERIFERARDLAAVVNHRLAAAAKPDFEPEGVLHQVKAPTLVVEGTNEPAKPGHGAIIAERIPGARLLMVEGMGHTLPPETHEELAGAILAHTSPDRT